MRILLLAASALALTVGTSTFAQGNGNRGGGGGKPERVQQGGGGGGQQAQRGGRGSGERAGRGNGGQGQAARAMQRGGPDREMRGRNAENRGPDRQERRVERGGRQMEQAERRQDRGERRADRRAMRVENGSDVARLRWEPTQGVGRGCPPGLAKKNNGCMPPGQVRQTAESQSWFRNWWAYPDSANFMFNDGYLVRLGNGGSVESFIPLLGGALWPGQAWPAQFQSYPVPDYHVDYFGLDNGLDYRFADGVVYGVNPTNQLIQQVAALVAGDDWSVGQAMPQGYDIYNVPYEFRDDYQDTQDAMYRYSDGYVYQVDPTTQLIQAAIQLIT